MPNNFEPEIVGTSFVLAVPNSEMSARYWCDVLGFHLQVTPPGWHFVVLGSCRVMLGECPSALPPSELGDHSYFAYIEVNELDRYYTEIKDRGAVVTSSPSDKAWGMREMSVRTPDGHRIMFGQKLQNISN
jgi:uncharacterized glyoxalase superfamily protein PhnB